LRFIKRLGRILLNSVAALIVLTVAFVIVSLLIRNQRTGMLNESAVLQNRLYIPPQLEPRIENGEKVFDLAAQEGQTTFFEGKPTHTFGFNGPYLGPTLRASTGDRVSIAVTNRLSETTTVHWHGMHLPAAMDGGPHQTIEPGATWQPHWTVTNRGLAGLFIIDDANSASLDLANLPQEYGVDDIPLIVQDRAFDSNGQFAYRTHDNRGDLPAPAGMLGDTILVNGTLAPYVDVPPKLVRLRVVNGSDGRRYNFGFSDDRPFYQIATDGGLLEAPVELTRLLLGAGERAEILVDLSDVTAPITLISYAVVGEDNAVASYIVRVLFGEDDEGQEFKVLELRPQAREPQAGNADSQAARPIPQKLNTIRRLSESDATTTRIFVLNASSINDKKMDHTRVDAVVKKGDVEIWEVSNESPFAHPFHVHGVQFLVLERKTQSAQGGPLPDYERGWKDTVNVNPSETVRLIMQFSDYADPHTPYMFHCHILEHEDLGMMGQFVVVDGHSQDVTIQSPLTEAPTGQHQHP
jgi:FtsP/CotA-like multicopper oxidase with cupredoxin domain